MYENYCYCLTKDAKQFLLSLINHYVATLFRFTIKYMITLRIPKTSKKLDKLINLLLSELKLITKSRSIKNYKGKSEEDLIKILTEPKPKINLTKKKIKEIKKD